MKEIAEYIPTIYYSELGLLAVSLPRAPALLINRKLYSVRPVCFVARYLDVYSAVSGFRAKKTPPRTKDLKFDVLSVDRFLDGALITNCITNSVPSITNFGELLISWTFCKTRK